MNIKKFALAGILSITISTPAMSEPAFNFEKIELEIDKRQSILEDNKTEETNPKIDEANATAVEQESLIPSGQGTVDKRLGTELDRADSNCHTTRTNTARENTFEGFCDWGF